MNKLEENAIPPVDLVLELKNRGFSKEQIVDNLQRQGYSSQLIEESLNQAEIKGSIEDAPSPSFSEMQSSSLHSTPQEQSRAFIPQAPQQQIQLQAISTRPAENIEEIAEAIVEEKFKRAMEDFGDFNTFRERVRTEIVSMKQEMLRMQSRFDSMQQAVIGKVQDYDKNISDVGVEIKALEKVLQNIIRPLSSNIKELSKIVDEMKKR
ncbi:MAG TPA: hypothetical protein VJB94_03515 [Candidatus Nanoarchaeia archaeon]|nr:hypothetical protein [Candidatus Nanoarchaeia archaeon]